MGRLNQTAIVLLCLSIVLTCSATQREDLERAAELAVEKAAERAAERAVEKALEAGNTTTESKIVRESYSNVRKEVPYREDPPYDSPSSSAEDEGSQEDESDEWIRYYKQFRIGLFKGWPSGSKSRVWRRIPRSGSSVEDLPWPKSTVLTIERKVPVPVTVEKRIPYTVLQPVPYEVKVPLPQPYTVEKKVPYPVRVFVNVPVEVPEPYTVEKKVPYEVKVDRPVPYKVEVPVPQPYTVEKRIPIEVKVPIALPYTVDKPEPYEVKVPVKVPQPYEVEKRVPVPVKVLVHHPYPVPAFKPYPTDTQSPYPVSVTKSYPAGIKVPANTAYQVPVERQLSSPVKVSETYAAEKFGQAEPETLHATSTKRFTSKPYKGVASKSATVSLKKLFRAQDSASANSGLNRLVAISTKDRKDGEPTKTPAEETIADKNNKSYRYTTKSN